MSDVTAAGGRGEAPDAQAVTVDHADIGQLAAVVGDDLDARRAVTAVEYLQRELDGAHDGVAASQHKIDQANADLASAKEAAAEAEAEVARIQAEFDAAVVDADAHIKRLTGATGGQ